MSYIISSTSPFVSIKLTEKGRENLAMGQLNFSYWAIGDSEINYDREAIVDANQSDITLSASSVVMRPFDRQPNIKSFIMNGTSNQNLQPLNAANFNVIKAVVNNEATERGFFTDNTTAFTTNLSSTLTPYYQAVTNTKLSGTTTLTLTSTTNVNVGDYILLKLTNSKVGAISANETTNAEPNLWYKVYSISGTNLTLDRALPNYSGDSASSQIIVYKGGEVYNTIATGNTTSYWDSGTLSFNSSVNITCSDVPVWNMNNVWCENMAGMSANTTYEDYTKFGSYKYLGTKNPYFEYMCESTAVTVNFNCNGPGISYPDDVTKSISILHYTNNAISNLYGEFFYIDATNDKYVIVDIPNLMYHRAGYSTGSGKTMGMTFIATGDTKLLGNSDIEYIDLIESPDMLSTANTMTLTVGKVFPQLKMVVFDDDEIVAAMSYKSNRNWTLPELAANIVSPTGGTSTGILQPNYTIYLTYSLEMSGSTGLTTSLPCQNYVKVTNNSSSAKDIAFRLNETDLLPYMRKKEDSGYDGYGFYAYKFKLLYQIVSDATMRPDPAAWKVYDYTSTAITSVAGQTIDPKLLENQNQNITGFVLDVLKDASATNFGLYSLMGMAPNSQPTNLQFGDERLFYGNLQTYIGATIFKTIFDIRVNSSYFDTTTNPTRSQNMSTNPADIRVTEVGVYDSNQNLVCIGKLSKPVSLMAGNTIMLELSLDF
jgi:hypothetical protein